MAQSANVRCPSCGAVSPEAELTPNGTIYCHRGERATGQAPPPGWYLLPDDSSSQQYWTGYEWSRGPPDPANKETAPCPDVLRVPQSAGASSAVRSEAEMHDNGTKTCPECAERVQGAALVCPFCGYRFDGNRESMAPGETSTGGVARLPRAVIAILAAVALIAGSFFFGRYVENRHTQHKISSSVQKVQKEWNQAVQKWKKEAKVEEQKAAREVQKVNKEAAITIKAEREIAAFESECVSSGGTVKITREARGGWKGSCS